MTRKHLAWLAGIALAAALAAPAPIAAQQGGGIRLLLVDDETGDPVVGAVLKIKDRPDGTTDEAGRALLEGLPAGRVEVEIRAIGYLTRKDYLNIQAGSTRDHRLSMSFTGEQLPEVVVNARRDKLMGRYQDYHRRQATGNGVFIGWEEIKQKNFSRLGDALRGVRGVRVLCRTHECTIAMARSSSCAPTIWVDGTENSYFGASMPIGDIYGIEVYRGSGEIPAEYAGTSGCGAIVLWSKNRPYK